MINKGHACPSTAPTSHSTTLPGPWVIPPGSHVSVLCRYVAPQTHTDTWFDREAASPHIISRGLRLPVDRALVRECRKPDLVAVDLRVGRGEQVQAQDVREAHQIQRDV